MIEYITLTICIINTFLFVGILNTVVDCVHILRDCLKQIHENAEKAIEHIQNAELNKKESDGN